MRLLEYFLLGGLAALAHGAAVPSSHYVHEKRSSSDEWVKRSRVSRKSMLPVRIGLAQRNLDKGMDHLMDISDPDSPNFGKHLTKSEVIELYAPSEETVNAVREWLVEHGIARHRIALSDNRAWMAFDGFAEEVEGLLLTEFHQYEHTSLGKRSVGTDEYHVPRHLEGHIDYITPGVKLAMDQRQKRSGGQELSETQEITPETLAKIPCYKGVSPRCIQSLMQIPPVEYTEPRIDNQLGLWETGQYYTPEDLSKFWTTATTNVPNDTIPQMVYVDSNPNDRQFLDVLKKQNATQYLTQSIGEIELDLTMAFPLIWPQQISVYQVDDPYQASNQSATGFDDFLDAVDGSFCTYTLRNQTGNDPAHDLPKPDNPSEETRKLLSPVEPYTGQLQCGTRNLTNILSISYNYPEQTLPMVYQQRACNEFIKLGLQGHTIVVSSGDGGIANKTGACAGPNKDIFVPSFPANCPGVLVVGGTRLVGSGTNDYDEEVAASLPGYRSGGGFTNVFPSPSYQQDALNSYFANHDPSIAYYNITDYTSYGEMGAGGAHYNRNGRGFPDIAAVSQTLYEVSLGKPSFGGGGTSAAAPIIASMLNRINEARLCDGKRPMGFINPILYKSPQIFKDITSGNNIVKTCKNLGFEATPGWDPVTGLGVPSYPGLFDVLSKLP